MRSGGRDLDLEIFTADADGSNITDITDNPSNDLWPSWSPDGSRIAFQSQREWHGYPSVYVMDADGSNAKCLTPEKFACQFPEWSPDGVKIIYSSSRYSNFGTSGLDLFSMNPDGSSQMPIFKRAAFRGHLTYAQVCTSWFPDGKKIVFTSNTSGVAEIYNTALEDLDISNTLGVPEIYNTPLEDLDIKKYDICVKHGCYFKFPPSQEFVQIGDFPTAVISPDGQSLAFDYYDSITYERDIYVLDIGSGEIKCLTDNEPTNCYFPTWSPDGSKIAFTYEEVEGNPDIYVMDADGGNPTLLIEDGMFPSWSRR